MHRPVVPALVALVVLVCAAVPAAGSVTSTGWDRISGPTEPGVQLGLARSTPASCT